MGRGRSVPNLMLYSKFALWFCLHPSLFSNIGTEYGDLLRKSPYSNRLQQNTRYNSLFGHFSCSGVSYATFTVTTALHIGVI